MEFPDRRTGSNTRYSLRDAALGAFSVFFTQSPSFLAHQQSMRHSQGNSNATTIFGLDAIPTDNWIRRILDPVAPSALAPIHRKVFQHLHEEGSIDGWRAFDGNLLVALDGRWFHSSESIHCANCNHQSHRDGRTVYYHSAITPVIVKPGANHVLSLEPQFIEPQDGAKKQDCENAAGKRWLTGRGLHYALLEQQPAHRFVAVEVVGEDGQPVQLHSHL